MDYENEMYIDHDALDIECLDQPQMMMKYAKKLATLKLERDQLKEEVDLVRAEQDPNRIKQSEKILNRLVL